MTYATEILQWRHYQIEVRYHPDPHPHIPRNGAAIAHLEIRCLSPDRAARTPEWQDVLDQSRQMSLF